MVTMRPFVSTLVFCSFLLSFLPFLVSVSGAGHSRLVGRTPVPTYFHHPASFPQWAQLKADTRLKEKYTSENKIQVHVVPHTHDDVGWLKTVDQYFVGANNSIQHAAVKYILDSVTDELLKDSSRRFVYVEQAFFQSWWSIQSPSRQAQVKSLIASGQLEFLNGGWCMHDEAATHYIDMIDQTTLGHQYILQEFGVTPKIGWQIDPFGHSATQAALLSGVVGFEGLFFGRIDHQDHDARMITKNMEFIWRPSPSLGTEGQVFTGVFQNGNYGPPTGFCFDWFCEDTPIITDQTMMDYNVPNRVQAFLDQINYQAAFTLGNNLMITMGSDFQYENAREWYENLDKLMAAVNADGRINVFYSTPSAYVAAKNAEGLTFTVKTDDFFPYSDDDHSYWTGYYTSRPALKRYVRTSSALLQAARHIELLSGGDGSGSLPLAKAVGVAQHHDAVAGTSKQHVAFDYAQRLHQAQAETQTMMAAGLTTLVQDGQSPSSVPPEFVFCELTNITVCPFTTSVPTTADDAFTIMLYNPLARSREEFVSLPIANTNTQLVVLDSNGTIVQSQITEVFNVSSHTPESSQTSLNFIATVPGLGYRSYFVVESSSVHRHSPAMTSTSPTAIVFDARRTRSHGRHLTPKEKARARKAATYISTLTPTPVNEDTTIQNEFIGLTFDGSSGAVKSYLDKVSGETYSFDVSWGYYESFAGDGQKSGAYIFRPKTEAPPRTMVPSGQLLVQTGPIVQEVVQIVNEWINQTFRIVQGRRFVEVEYTVGEIPLQAQHGLDEDGEYDDGENVNQSKGNFTDQVGKEVVVQYVSQLVNDGVWYSDSNAREMIRRVRNQRESWNLTVTEPIAGNYVPMTGAAFLTDGTTQLTVLNDRAQGVSSMVDGSLEVMVHRRTLADDQRGVGEALNETDYMSPYPDFVRSGPGLIITGKHYLFFGNSSGSSAVWRPLMQRIYQPLLDSYASLPSGPDGGGVSTYIATHNVESTFLGLKDLPVNVDLISFENWSQWAGSLEGPSAGARNGSVMIRLAHMFGVGEDSYLSQPVEVDLATLFTMPPNSIQQVSLTANKLDAPTPVPLRSSVVTLNPMEIQTFIITF